MKVSTADINFPAWALFIWSVWILLKYGGTFYGATDFIMQMIAIGSLAFLVKGGCRVVYDTRSAEQKAPTEGDGS